MPLIKPEVQKVLRASNLLDAEKTQTDESTISAKFAEAGLSDDTIAENYAEIALHSGNDALRLRALDSVAKIRGALKEAPAQIPTFTLIIQSAAPDSPHHEVNPIIFPRTSSISTAQVDSKKPD